MWLDGKSPINRPAQMGKSALHEAMFADTASSSPTGSQRTNPHKVLSVTIRYLISQLFISSISSISSIPNMTS